ncbi:hypothetical protein SS50377_25966 [Spironucleus salmonicida]|uniref:Uncharacterized protein n=1 Tax=Spironucleus salmonicida TaxID=348837 RepID=V6LRK7_9EUKA|nr:hypothetical protein SS50377_25966 [Spironucleus salmonicida]|eukprot:EST47292.1 Hypothetical protein SS50377_12639 [Spironucleus salmonicida]
MPYQDTKKTILPVPRSSILNNQQTSNSINFRNNFTTTQTRFSQPPQNMLKTQAMQNAPHTQRNTPKIPNFEANPFIPPSEIKQFSHREAFETDERSGMRIAQKLGRDDLIHRLEQQEIRAQRRREAENRVFTSYGEEEKKIIGANQAKLVKIRQVRDSYIRALEEEEKERGYLMK